MRLHRLPQAGRRTLHVCSLVHVRACARIRASTAPELAGVVSARLNRHSQCGMMRNQARAQAATSHTLPYAVGGWRLMVLTTDSRVRVWDVQLHQLALEADAAPLLRGPASVEGSRECAARHTHTCMHAHVHMHACTHAHTHIHACTHAHTHILARTHAHTHIHACTHAHTHIHACTRIHTYIHTYTRVPIFMRTHTAALQRWRARMSAPRGTHIHARK